METFIPLDPEVIGWLSEVAEHDDIPPEFWVRKKLREFCDGIYSQPLTLKGRRLIKFGNRTLRYDEMRVLDFTPSDLLPADRDGIHVTLGKYLLERLPLSVAWVDYTAPEDQKSAQEWHTFSEWASVYVTSQIATESAKLVAEEDRKEENAALAIVKKK